MQEYSKIESLNIQNPWEGFQKWWQEAQNIGLNNFNAVGLSTADLQGKVTSRTVLLKDFSKEQGFIFYTNKNSCKGQALQANPYAAMLFYWDALQRQIKIEGSCHFLSSSETKEYFHSRPRQSQIAAHASHQSSVLENRKQLLDQYYYYEKKFTNETTIPIPEYWRGVVLMPKELEFWQGGDFRLHQRLRFFFQNNYSWESKILSP